MGREIGQKGKRAGEIIIGGILLVSLAAFAVYYYIHYGGPDSSAGSAGSTGSTGGETDIEIREARTEAGILIPQSSLKYDV